jgi:phosphatidate cytidylyltransferase
VSGASASSSAFAARKTLAPRTAFDLYSRSPLVWRPAATRSHVTTTLAKRVTSAIVLGAIVLPVILVGGPYFLAGTMALALLASWEYGRMLAGVGYRPQYPLLAGLAILLPLEAYFRTVPSLQSEILVGAVLLSLSGQVFRRNSKHPLLDWALSLAGALYISLPLAFAILLRNLTGGMYWVFLMLLIVWTCDSCAYLAGTTFGRHGFFTHVSPKKTVEGALGGIIAGSVVAFAGVPFLPISPAQAIPLGLAISLAATFGDLAESLIKRQLKTKDSGNTIPGHGGFLDRIDSVVLSVVVMYWFAVWIARFSW